MGVTGKKVELSGIGGRARTMAGAGPTDLHYMLVFFFTHICTSIMKQSPIVQHQCMHLKKTPYPCSVGPQLLVANKEYWSEPNIPVTKLSICIL